MQTWTGVHRWTWQQLAGVDHAVNVAVESLESLVNHFAPPRFASNQAGDPKTLVTLTASTARTSRSTRRIPGSPDGPGGAGGALHRMGLRN